MSHNNSLKNYAAALAILTIFVISLSIFSFPDNVTGFAADIPPPPPPPAYCGDGFCDAGETRTNCPADCGETPPQAQCIAINQSTNISSNQNDKCYIIRSGVIFDGNNHALSGNKDIAIIADNANGFTVKNFTISGYKTGISAENSSSFAMSGNNISAGGQGTIQEPLAGIRIKNSGSAAVTGNSISMSGIRSYGIFASDSGTSLSSNTIMTSGQDSHGFMLIGGSHAIERNYIKTIQPGSHGIKLSGAERLDAAENQIVTSASDSPALLVEQSSAVVVSENELNTSGSTSPALRISTSPGYIAENNRINSAGSGSDGLLIINSDSGRLADNFIISSGVGASGISISYSGQTIISGGSISGEENGIRATGSDAMINTATVNSNGYAIYVDSASSARGDAVATGNSVVNIYGTAFAFRDAEAPQAPAGYAVLDAIEAVSTGTGARLLLTLKYSDAMLQGLMESSISIWKYSSSQWNQSGFYTNRGMSQATKEVFADINSFPGIFAMAATAQVQQNSSCQQPGSWSGCTQKSDGSWKKERIFYSGISCAPATESEPCCPPSQCNGEASEWSKCQNSVQTRSIRICDVTTNFTCSSQAEMKLCNMRDNNAANPGGNYTLILILLAGAAATALIVVYAVYKKRMGIMGSEEKSTKTCVMCGSPATGMKCATCKGMVCIEHAVKKNGKIYCENHA